MQYCCKVRSISDFVVWFPRTLVTSNVPARYRSHDRTAFLGVSQRPHRSDRFGGFGRSQALGGAGSTGG